MTDLQEASNRPEHAVADTSTSSSPPSVQQGEASGNPERKARKEAQKAAKAAQAAAKKAAKQHAAAEASSSSSPTATSSTANSQGSSNGSSKKPHRLDPRSQPTDVQLSKALSYILRHGALKEGLEIRADGFIKLDDVLQRPRVKSINMAESTGGKRRPELKDVLDIVESNDKQRFEVRREEADGWWIRAVQGHSIKAVTEMEHVTLTRDNLDALLSLGQVTSKDDEDPNESLLSQLEAASLQAQVQAQEKGSGGGGGGGGGGGEGGSAGQHLVIHGTNPAAWDQILASGGLKPMTRNHIHLAKGKFGQQGVISGMRKSASRLIYIDVARALADGIPFTISSNGVVLTPGDPAADGLLHSRYFVRVEDQNGNVVWSPSE
ncbi:hypothetical protein BCV70DRAFT_203297 [Testicularia cyperi]|uniref:2'-phosphotransferase n=1 Tax=Testicularia cyperi TaxID=1882483 RepID=A0A317XEQ3_9BASI|nr:hypothetical protein BCV70DRAFT_203297 [Testicularia cyperi]